MKQIYVPADIENVSFATRDEVDTFLSIVHENTETLRSRIDILENAKLHLSVFFTSVLTIATFLIPTVLKFGVLKNTVAESTSFLSGAIVASIFMSVAYVLYFSRLRRSERDIRRVAEVLGILVRRGSQLRDRGEFGFAQKIYVDIRLSEAETVIDQASIVSRSLAARMVRAMTR